MIALVEHDARNLVFSVEDTGQGIVEDLAFCAVSTRPLRFATSAPNLCLRQRRLPRSRLFKEEAFAADVRGIGLGLRSES